MPYSPKVQSGQQVSAFQINDVADHASIASQAAYSSEENAVTQINDSIGISPFWARLTSEPTSGNYEWEAVQRDLANETFDSFDANAAITYDLTAVYARSINGDSGIYSDASDGTVVYLHPTVTSSGDMEYLFVPSSTTFWGKIKSRSNNEYTFDQYVPSITGTTPNRSVSWSASGISNGIAVEANGNVYSPWDYSGTPAWQDMYVQLIAIDSIYSFTMPMPPPTGIDNSVLIHDSAGKFGWSYPRIHT